VWSESPADASIDPTIQIYGNSPGRIQLVAVVDAPTTACDMSQDPNQPVLVSPGQMFSIAFESQPGTGYSWTVSQAPDPAVVEPVQHYDGAISSPPPWRFRNAMLRIRRGRRRLDACAVPVLATIRDRCAACQGPGRRGARFERRAQRAGSVAGN
jgi:hypothetical protein